MVPGAHADHQAGPPSRHGRFHPGLWLQFLCRTHVWSEPASHLPHPSARPAPELPEMGCRRRACWEHIAPWPVALGAATGGKGVHRNEGHVACDCLLSTGRLIFAQAPGSCPSVAFELLCEPVLPVQSHSEHTSPRDGRGRSACPPPPPGLPCSLPVGWVPQNPPDTALQELSTWSWPREVQGHMDELASCDLRVSGSQPACHCACACCCARKQLGIPPGPQGIRPRHQDTSRA